jgi:hypothetical protein
MWLSVRHSFGTAVQRCAVLLCLLWRAARVPSAAARASRRSSTIATLRLLYCNYPLAFAYA